LKQSATGYCKEAKRHFWSGNMSEPIAAEIRIGGPVPATLVPGLCRAIAQERLSLDWGDAPFSPTTKGELLAARDDLDGALLLRFYDDQASYGEFEELEHFLQRHGIPFDRLSEPKWEFTALTVVFRPGRDLIEVPTDPQHRPTVLAESLGPAAKSLTRAIHHMEKGDAQKALRAAKRAERLLEKSLPPAVPPLETFAIIEEP
jgi:hypothetical protein